MIISLDNTRKMKKEGGPRILIYGSPGIGKTTLASEFPDPIFIQTEDSAPRGVECQTFGIIRNFQEVIQAIGCLVNDDHEYQTLVIDSITVLQQLIYSQICHTYGKSSIDAMAFGKGYSLAVREWRKIIRGFNRLSTEKWMNIILVGHSTVERFEDPLTQAYDRYVPYIHKKSWTNILLEMDAVLFLGTGAMIDRNGKRIPGPVAIHTVETQGYYAKNRFLMPPKIDYSMGGGYKALEKFLPKRPEPVVPEIPEERKQE